MNQKNVEALAALLKQSSLSKLADPGFSDLVAEELAARGVVVIGVTDRDGWEAAVHHLQVGCRLRGVNPDDVEREGRKCEEQSLREMGFTD